VALVVEGKTLLTYSEYVLFPEDGKRHEIIRGVHYVTPSPITKHQRVSRWIQFQLFEQIELKGLGEVINAPMDVILSEIDILQPDLMVILRKNLPIVNPKNVRGAPDLVVEITSPATKKRDLELKKDVYRAFGVPEYWIVLCEENAVEKHILQEGAYQSGGRFTDHIEFGGLPGITVELTKVW